MINRRRLLIGAVALAIPVRAQAETRWAGVALGADVQLTLRGDQRQAQDTLLAVQDLLSAIEDDFSLYRPNSAICQLNKGLAVSPTQQMTTLFDLCDQMHHVTAGRFDPSVQPLWKALAEGRDLSAARKHVGWQFPQSINGKLRLAPHQELTLNGIAQGFATDLVRDLLAARGYKELVVNMGETAALGGPFHLGLADPGVGMLGTVSLTNRALAVSSPRATLVGGQPHILSAKGDMPKWSTVGVEADSAAVADALSTALTFANIPEITMLQNSLPGLHRVFLVSEQGELTVLGG